MRAESSIEKVVREKLVQILYLKESSANVKLCLRALVNANPEFHCDPVSPFLSSAESDAVRLEANIMGKSLRCLTGRLSAQMEEPQGSSLVRYSRGDPT